MGSLLATVIIRPRINLNTTGIHAKYQLVFYPCMFTPVRKFSMFTSPTKAIKMSDCFLLAH